MIPFHTMAERHLVYVYCVVWLLQFGNDKPMVQKNQRSWRLFQLRRSEEPYAPSRYVGC
jgi:hypothetical protein